MFYALRAFDVMKKAVEKTHSAFLELDDAIVFLKTEINLSTSAKKIEDMQKAILILNNASSLIIDVFILLEKYDERFK